MKIQQLYRDKRVKEKTIGHTIASISRGRKRRAGIAENDISPSKSNMDRREKRQIVRLQWNADRSDGQILLTRFVAV